MKSILVGVALLTGARATAGEPTSLIGMPVEAFPSNLRAQLRECIEDIAAVQRGEAPLHATLGVPPKQADGSIKKGPDGKTFVMEVLMDGGTRLYQGRGYTIVARHSIARIGGVTGYLVGPEVKFEPPLSPTVQYDVAVSSVRFVVSSQSEERGPNKSSEPTGAAVTPPAAQESRHP